MAPSESSDPVRSSSKRAYIFEKQIKQQQKKKEEEVKKPGIARVADAERVACPDKIDFDKFREADGTATQPFHRNTPHIRERLTAKRANGNSVVSTAQHASRSPLYDVTPQPGPLESGDSSDDQTRTDDHSNIVELKREIRELKANQVDLEQKITKQDEELRTLRKRRQEAEDQLLNGDVVAQETYDTVLRLLNGCRQERGRLEEELNAAKERERELKRHLHEAKEQIDAQKHDITLLRAILERSNRDAELGVSRNAQAADALQHQTNSTRDDIFQQKEASTELSTELSGRGYKPEHSRSPSSSIPRGLKKNGGAFRKNGHKMMLVVPTIPQDIMHGFPKRRK
jgi:DNA repair exonuclease SbcCD ATPase subunit